MSNEAFMKKDDRPACPRCGMILSRMLGSSADMLIHKVSFCAFSGLQMSPASWAMISETKP